MVHCHCFATGYYFSGDGALRDKEGDYRITGRVDDVVNVKGHRIGTAEIECAMVTDIHIVRYFHVYAYSGASLFQTPNGH